MLHLECTCPPCPYCPPAAFYAPLYLQPLPLGKCTYLQAHSRRHCSVHHSQTRAWHWAPPHAVLLLTGSRVRWMRKSLGSCQLEARCVPPAATGQAALCFMHMFENTAQQLQVQEAKGL